MPAYKFTALDTLPSVAGVAAEWNELTVASEPNVFLTHAWYCAWSERLSRDIPAIRPHVLAVRREGQIAGLAPLVYWRHTRLGVPLRKLEFAGIHADYNGFLLSSPQQENAAALLAHLAATASAWDILDLRELTAESAGLLRAAAAENGLYCHTTEEPDCCPYLPVTPEDSDPLWRLPGDARRELRRRMKRAEAMGCTVRIVEQPQNESGLLEKLTALDRAKNTFKHSPVFIGQYPEVFAALFRELGPRGWLYVALLEQEGRPIAFQLGFRCGRRLWDYTKAFDRAFAHLAPGTLLLPPLLQYAQSHGFEEYDFLRGEEPYKLRWSTQQRKRYRLLIWNRTQRSKMAKWLFRDAKALLTR